MNLLSKIKIHGFHHPNQSSILLSPPHFLSLQSLQQKPNLSFSTPLLFPTSKPKLKLNNVRVSNLGEASSQYTENFKKTFDGDDLTVDGEAYNKTLRLVECSMFAALGGLTYILSSSLAIENYFGCFFALPIVFSSMRWGLAAGRKTMVATAILLLVLAGPVKALTYLLMYGFLGLTMGSLWRLLQRKIRLFLKRPRLRANWGLSIGLSAMARALGASGYVVMLSFLIRENIFALITINVHASLTYILTSLGFLTIPSMGTIYIIFGTLVFINSSFFVFLLHLLYSVFFTRLGMKGSLSLPRWLERAI